MASAEILAAARELMLVHHGPQCAQRPLWERLAALLAEAETDAAVLAGADSPEVVDPPPIQPLATDCLDLPAPDHAKEHVHARS